MRVDYFQVGAHVGNTANDMIFGDDILGKKVVLVEPVPYLFRKLVENYREKSLVNSITFLNLAVSDRDGELELHVPSERNNFHEGIWWADQISSVNPDHIAKHSLDILVDVIRVPCKRLMSIFKEMSIDSVGNLLIDTEGHDYEILMDLDLSKVNVENIVFENRHMDGVGVRGARYDRLLHRLQVSGYAVVSETDEDTHVRQLSK